MVVKLAPCSVGFYTYLWWCDSETPCLPSRSRSWCKLQEQLSTLGRSGGRHNSQAINHARSCVNLKIFDGKGYKDWRDTFRIETSQVEPEYCWIFDWLERTEEDISQFIHVSVHLHRKSFPNFTSGWTLSR